jgi:hypothetical protein
MVSWDGKLEENRLRLYRTNKKLEISEDDDVRERKLKWEKKSPRGKENELKFHSSELKIKLPSQTELNQYLPSADEISVPP